MRSEATGERSRYGRIRFEDSKIAAQSEIMGKLNETEKVIGY